MKKIFLIRHPETEYPTKFYGSTDVNLSKNGKHQAELLCETLFNKKIEAVYSSDMKRTLYPSYLISKRYKINHFIESKLKEVDFGRWEGLIYNEIINLDKKLVDQWLGAPETFTFPGGEEMNAFLNRIKEVFSKLQKNKRYENIAIITHGGVIKSLLCLLLNKPLKALWEIPQDFGAINLIECADNSAIEVKLINDITFMVKR
ncbi:MAG: histidine phosphatase family protein [bacterium]